MRTAGVMASEHGEVRAQTVELSEAALKLVIEGGGKLQDARVGWSGESSQSEPSERPPTRSGDEKNS